MSHYVSSFSNCFLLLLLGFQAKLIELNKIKSQHKIHRKNDRMYIDVFFLFFTDNTHLQLYCLQYISLIWILLWSFTDKCFYSIQFCHIHFCHWLMMTSTCIYCSYAFQSECIDSNQSSPFRDISNTSIYVSHSLQMIDNKLYDSI